MRFRTLNHNLINSAIDNDWFLQEEINRKNKEEQKKVTLKKKEMSLSDTIASPRDLLKNMSAKKQKILKSYVKTDLNLRKQQGILDFGWKKELSKKTLALKDKSWALNNMFRDGFADKWNAKNKLLMHKKQKNLLRLHKII